MNIFALLIILICVMMTSFFIAVIYIGRIIRLEMKERREERKLEYIASYDINESDSTILDSVIQDSFNRFCFLHFDTVNQDYINSKTQEEMITETMKLVFSRLSPYFMTKLSFIYNREYIEDMILEKIQAIVVDYSVEVNGQLNSD